jgi:hypothetical protein
MSQLPDTLVVATRDGLSYSIASRNVQRLDASGGSSRFSGAVKGTLVGGLVGLGFLSIISAPVGLIVGTAIGHESWTRIYPPLPPR